MGLAPLGAPDPVACRAAVPYAQMMGARSHMDMHVGFGRRVQMAPGPHPNEINAENWYRDPYSAATMCVQQWLKSGGHRPHLEFGQACCPAMAPKANGQGMVCTMYCRTEGRS